MQKNSAVDGRGEFRDRIWAVATSIALHLLAFGWMWLGGDHAGWGKSKGPGDSKGEGMSANFFARDEFRQRIENEPSPAASEISLLSEDPHESEAKTSIELAPDLPESAVPAESTEQLPIDHALVKTTGSAPAESVEAGLSQRRENAEGGGADGLRAAYLAALRAAIRQQWHYTGTKQRCLLTIEQLPGGEVQSSEARDCLLPPEVRRTLEAAVLIAQPLPFEGYESVYSATVVLSFEDN